MRGARQAFLLSVPAPLSVISNMTAVPDQDPAGQAREEERALAARALAGDRQALGSLVSRYAGAVRRLTRAILGNPDDADDAAQDALLSALVKLDQYDTDRPFGPWLLRIVANAAIDRRRRRSVRDGSILDANLASPGPLPDAEAERRALGERLEAALGTLPERYRTALVLFEVEGYSQAEIAHILGMAPGTVRSAVFHARRRLRRRLGDWREEE
jgi:RNA polymerase sigma factor (sigma-70 family)